MGGGGFEPPWDKPAGLQPAAFDRSATHPALPPYILFTFLRAYCALLLLVGLNTTLSLRLAPRPHCSGFSLSRLSKLFTPVPSTDVSH